MSAEIAAVEPLPRFRSAARLALDQVDILRPPRRMSVSAAAERFRRLKNPGGGYSGAWRNDQVPYMVEPADMMTSRRHEAVIFVGPAQSGKTAALIENAIVHAVACDPADMLVVQMSEVMARDFSRRRVDRMIRECEILADRLDPQSDNVFDKAFPGMLLSIGHPTIAQLSSRPIPRVLLTDYDRMPEDVGGEGAPFDLAQKRTQTFGSRGVTLAESSPGHAILAPKWKPDPTAPHEAPPTHGVLALYNRGDRRRWFWPCPHCGEHFEGAFKHLEFPSDASPDEAAAAVVMICPVSGCVIEPAAKAAMNAAGRWVAEGQRIEGGEIVGRAPDRRIASYWLKGTAAAFQSWGGLVAKFLRAYQEYEKTGSEHALKTTVNTDQGEPYREKAADVEGTLEADELIEKAEAFPLRVVPVTARYLTASVDVQANRFEVLVRAWGQALESWVIDRFTIFQAGEGDDARPVDPARYIEDWSLLVDQVLDRRYRCAVGGELQVVRMGVDSGGAAGVTANAYEFYRRRRGTPEGRRLMLLKGASVKTAPRIVETFPDSKRKDRKAARRGEVPVYVFNPNLLKDETDAGLRRDEGGPRALHLTRALMSDAPPHVFFEEATAEQRRPDGTWQKVKQRNEALDLLVMSHAVALGLRAERIDWSSPPSWGVLDGGNPYWRPTDEAAVPEIDAPPADAAPAETHKPETPAKRAAARRGRRRGGFVQSWKG